MSLPAKIKKRILTNQVNKAFILLKSKLISAPILGYPDISGGTFTLDTYTGSYAIGALLSQVQDGKDEYIAYDSRIVSTA